MKAATRNALIAAVCLAAGACATTDHEPRPLAAGFASTSGVTNPYEDGKAHLAAGRHETAIERFAQALADDRRSLAALNGLGISYARLGRFEVAHRYFERALQLEPTDAATLNNYGWSLAEQGRWRDAEPFLDLALVHAAEDDAPLVTSNLASIGQARPHVLVAWLDADHEERRAGGHRLIRVGADVYRLETDVDPSTGPETAPAVTGDDT